MALENGLIPRLAAELEAARRERREVERLTAAHPGLTLPEAYVIQDEVIRLRLELGEKIVGLKMGLTSKAKMKQMGVESPIYGVLTDAMKVESGARFAVAGCVHPRIEPEVAFVTARELKGRPSQEEALVACSGVCAAMEIIDSRYKAFSFTLPDVVADNCSSCAFVLGPVRPVSGLDLGNLAMNLELDGKIVQSGSSSDIYGHPAASLAELCAMLDARGRSLPAGSLVLAGAATQAIALAPGSRVRVLIEGLPEASVSC